MQLDFKKNLGDTDRIIRIIIGATLTWLAIFQLVPGGWIAAAIVLGVSQLIEGALGY